MDFILENLDDILELLLEGIRVVFRFVTRRLIPFIAGLVGSIRHKQALKRFKDDLDIKKENIRDGGDMKGA